MRGVIRISLIFAGIISILPGAENTVHLEGQILDGSSGDPLPARLYIESRGSKWFLARSAAEGGVAVTYNKQRGSSVDVHTTLSAHPFAADLLPGTYTLTAERGKEYFPAVQDVTLVKDPVRVILKLRRWINMAKRGWYSGDTHVHRGLDELPLVLQAEDLNVAFPLLYWITEAFKAPDRGRRNLKDPGAKILKVDDTHVVYPRNTEYEIFSVRGRKHTLGAVFLLNHRTVLLEGVPPVGWVAREVHRQGGLIELDKHAWPWSMVLVPVMDVDLYELSNNHLWRADFFFKDWGEPAAAYMEADRDQAGWTERGWIEYGLQNYYTLLNCGFRLRPTAGTASGVHPVPLGFSRVYVHLPGGFSYEGWVKGLDEGRSFVTTGPMLFIQVNGKEAGHVFQAGKSDEFDLHVTGEAVSEGPLDRVELILNGKVFQVLKPENVRTIGGAYKSRIDLKLCIYGPSWIAVRAFEERPGGRIRFAHTAPAHIEFEGRTLSPRKEEVDFLIRRVKSEIDRSSDLLPRAAIQEYEKALKIYQDLAEKAR